MSNTDANVLRLAARNQIMAMIDRRREIEGDMGIGASIERQILSQELAGMEESCESPADAGASIPR
jgi:hypothetical protein